MLFAGFDVFQGNLTLPGIIVAGVIGDMAGATIAYGIGYYGSQELLDRQGSKLHIRPGSIERAHRWFNRYGIPVMFFTRLLPFIRAVFPYAAGVARMSSLASLASFAAAPCFALVLEEFAVVKLAFTIAVLVFVRHQGNIRRLLAGTEPRIGRSKTERA